MSRRYFALTVALAVAAGFFASLLAGAVRRADGSVVASARAAESTREGEDGAGPWEYCAVMKAQYPRRVVQDIEAGPGGNAFSKAVNRLGAEGWEMVGQGTLEVRAGIPGPAPAAVFFKRRRLDK